MWTPIATKPPHHKPWNFRIIPSTRRGVPLSLQRRALSYARIAFSKLPFLSHHTCENVVSSLRRRYSKPFSTSIAITRSGYELGEITLPTQEEEQEERGQEPNGKKKGLEEGGGNDFERRRVFVSGSTNPYFNLAFEDWLFRKFSNPEKTLLYFYRNEPCVVIGRNQNPWKEIDLRLLQKLGIKLVRRKSGGGAVYHDLGNTNYSVLLPRTSFNRRSNAELVAAALNDEMIPAEVNERHDVVVDGFKASGSAFKLTSSRAYHHGTMLLHTKLSNLKGVLGPHRPNIQTKGVSSVPSPVRNLSEWNPDISHELFIEAVIKRFAERERGKDDNDDASSWEPVVVKEGMSFANNPYVREVKQELESWDWVWGQTPEFTNDLLSNFDWGTARAKITSKSARITSLDLSLAPSFNPSLALQITQAENLLRNWLIGDKYWTLDQTRARFLEAFRSDSGSEDYHGEVWRTVKEVMGWLDREM